MPALCERIRHSLNNSPLRRDAIHNARSAGAPARRAWSTVLGGTPRVCIAMGKCGCHRPLPRWGAVPPNAQGTAESVGWGGDSGRNDSMAKLAGWVLGSGSTQKRVWHPHQDPKEGGPHSLKTLPERPSGSIMRPAERSMHCSFDPHSETYSGEKLQGQASK